MTVELKDYDSGLVGIDIQADGKKIWVCIDGMCALRVKGVEHLEVNDARMGELVKKAARRICTEILADDDEEHWEAVAAVIRETLHGVGAP